MQYHDVAGTQGIFIVVWMPNDAFHSKHLLVGMIILNITHGIRKCIKRKKITYGKFFDFCAQKCI